MSLSDQSASTQDLVAQELGFETIDHEDACDAKTGPVNAKENGNCGVIVPAEISTNDRENGSVWLKLEKGEEGFSVSLLDTSDDAVELWEVVDEVYLLQDDRIRSLSSTRAKVLSVGLLEAFGGLALSYSALAPGVVATTAGCLALQCGLETIKTSVIGTDAALTREQLKTIIRKNCILGTIGGLTSSVMPALPIIAQCSVTGAVCSASSELIERREAETKLKLRKGTPLARATVWGALTGNIPYLLDNHGASIMAGLLKPD